MSLAELDKELQLALDEYRQAQELRSRGVRAVAAATTRVSRAQAAISDVMKARRAEAPSGTPWYTEQHPPVEVPAFR